MGIPKWAEDNNARSLNFAEDFNARIIFLNSPEGKFI